ncbi:MAG: YicC/YloC family endoribonuclease [Granulosicoccaceae bacterium]
MPKSMTGFGRHSKDTSFGELTWEIRSVNHRYLDVQLRLPDDFRAHDIAIREAIAARVSRGKVDASLRLRANSESVSDIQIDSGALSALSSAIATIKQAVPNSAPVNPLEILHWPGVAARRADLTEDKSREVMACLDTALNDFLATRDREGEKTAEMLSSRAAQIRERVADVKQCRPAVVERQQAKLKSKLKEFDLQADPQRLEQEMVFTAQRLDIDEEIDRLDAHLNELDKVLMRSGPIGRRLDFLMQEFNREANTMGSKSSDVDTTGATVDIKVLIEQMREQVQNIE